MFHEIDYENWDRKEIYEAFEGFSYSMTVELDMTELREYMRRTGRKFYPLICWTITKTVNRDRDFRIVKKAGKVGYFDELHTSYTLRRAAKPHLFTHMVTEYDADLDVYYSASGRTKPGRRRKTACIITGKCGRTMWMFP